MTPSGVTGERTVPGGMQRGAALTGDILGKLGRPGAPYFLTVAGLLAVLGLGAYAFAWQVRTGLGMAGYQPPILWGVYITNFVFWIGITHSGTR